MAKAPENIRGALALATCGLLAPGTSQAAGELLDLEDWDIDSAVLFYSERDRVNVVEPTVSARKDLGNDDSLTFHGVFDTMTGASPNGATASDRAQTFTSASGDRTDTIDPGEIPVAEFRDVRAALGVEWETPAGAAGRRIFGLNGSIETDYLSAGGSFTRLWDVHNRQTTFMAGLAVNVDIVAPEGGTPEALQRLSAAAGNGNDNGGFTDGETKTGMDAIAGVTQVLSPRALLQANYTLSLRDGYLNDPYKLVSLIDADGVPTDYVYERRPDRRLAHIVYLKYVYRLPEDVLRVSYRYFNDDWGVRAHTVDIDYRFELGRGFFLAPHVRGYTQGAADFYRLSLPETGPTPSHASADYRLADMDGATVGLKLGQAQGEDSEWSLLIERMKETGDSHPDEAVGIQRDLDMYPDLEALIVQLNYFVRF